MIPDIQYTIDIFCYLIWSLDISMGDPHDQQTSKDKTIEYPHSQTVTVHQLGQVTGYDHQYYEYTLHNKHTYVHM